MIKIPNNKQFIQNNLSDVSGNVFRTKNITFDDVGKMKLSQRTLVIADNSTYADLSTSNSTRLIRPATASNGLFLTGNKNMYYIDLSTTGDAPNFTKDAATGTPTLSSVFGNDMTSWDDDVYVCNDANIYSYSGAPGINTWSTFSTENGESLEPFTNLNQLAVKTDNETVKLLNTSGTVIQTLTVPDGFDIISMKYNNERLYLSSILPGGQNHSLVFEWDGLSSSANNAYVVDNATVFSLTQYKEGVAGLASDGRLLYFRGGVQELAKLPIFNFDYNWTNSVGSDYLSNPISRHSLASDGQRIYISIDSSISKAGYNRNDFPRRAGDFPSGVWCYDPGVGLYHRYAVGQSRSLKTDDIATTDVNTSTDVITVAGATVPATGTPCTYKNKHDDSGTSITGLTSGQKYYVINVSSTTLKLATSRANALAGTAIDLTGTGGNDQFIVFHEEYDFGGIGNGCEAITAMPGRWFDNQDGAILNNIFIVGSQIFDSSTSEISSLSAVVDGLENRGYYISPRIESTNIEDTYNSVTVKFSKLKNPEDEIIVKYRVKETDLKNHTTFSNATIVWTDSNTFTTTDDLSEVVVGDEVEITEGAGAGYLAHVTAISESGGTYTVDIDEEIRNLTASDVGYAIFQNWTKLGSVGQSDKENKQGYKMFRISKKAKWLQLKIELRGVDTTIEEIIINNTTNKPID